MFVHTALPPDDGRCYVKVTPAIQATWDRLSLDPALVASVQAARSALPLPPSSDLKMAGGAAIPVIPSVPAPDTPSVTQTYDEAQQAAVDALSAHGS